MYDKYFFYNTSKENLCHEIFQLLKKIANVNVM